MSASRAGYVVCPRCQLPNPIGPPTCWKCGTPLPTTGPAVHPSGFSLAAWNPPGSATGGPTALPEEGPFETAASSPTSTAFVPGPRRVRRGRLVVGIVLAVIGVLLVAGSFAVNSGTTTTSVPAGDGVTIHVTSLTAITVTVSWSGGNSTTTVFFTSGTPACTGASGVVREANGSSGTFTVTANPGLSYSLYACSGGAGQAATFSYSLSGGFSTLELIGVVLIAIGAIVVLLAFRRPRDD